MLQLVGFNLTVVNAAVMAGQFVCEFYNALNIPICCLGNRSGDSAVWNHLVMGLRRDAYFAMI